MFQSSTKLINAVNRSSFFDPFFPEHVLRQSQSLRFIRSSTSTAIAAQSAVSAAPPGSLPIGFIDPPDNAGNTLATARSVTLSSTAQTFNDFVGTVDPNDFYRFTVAETRNLNLSLTGLSADADIQLLDGTGGVIQTSQLWGSDPESIQRSLAAGTYYIRVYQFSGDTNYTLQASAARVDGAGNTLGTARSITVNSTAQTFNDFVGAEDTNDYYQFSLASTQTVNLSLTGLSADADLQLLNTAGNVIQTSESIDNSPESIVRSLTAGTYYIRVYPYSGDTNYTLQTTAFTPTVLDPTVGTFNPSSNSRMNTLLNPIKTFWNTSQNGGKITYSFYRNASGSYYGSEVVSELSDGVKNNVRNILSMVSSYINVNFVEVADTATQFGVLRYMFSNLGGGGGYAYAYYPSGGSLGGDVHLSPSYESDSVNRFSGAPGNHGFMTLIHETLHAIGLKHPGNYNGSGTGDGPFLSGGDDNSTNTLMTYNFNGAKAITPMAYDIEAMQYLYGSRNTNGGNTTYSFSTVHSYSVGGQTFGNSITPIKQSIWDRGGIDTLDFSGLSTANSYRFDLRPSGILTTQSAFNSLSYTDRSGGGTFTTSQFGTTIAFRTAIENLVNSGANDTIFANNSANRFQGYSRTRATGRDIYSLTNASDVLEMGDFSLNNLNASISGSDLVLGLGSSRSIRIRNYYGTGGSTDNSMRVQLGSTYYVYSQTAGWQTVAPPPILPAATVPNELGLTALPVVAPVNDVPTIACTCTYCASGGTNPLQQTLTSAIGLA